MGKSMFPNGNIFIGEHQRDLMSNGKLYEPQSNFSYTEFKVKFDYKNDYKKGIRPS